jgi:hypothetical protein
MIYSEGIDKVDVLLNPLFFNKQNIVKHKDPYHRLKLRPVGTFWALSIQAEWFSPFLDYQMQVAWAVYELVREGVLSFPDTPGAPFLIYLFHELFFLNVIAIEFYSDFKENNIQVDTNMVFSTIDEAKENGGLYQYYDKEKREFTETCYSPDRKGARKSQFITYNRLNKSIKDNNKGDVKKLINMQNPIRCEFKLYATNSEWLHWDNLRGPYPDIFNRYKRYLATIYNNQVAGCISVKGKENPNFRKVVVTASNENNTRFKNRKHTPQLKKREVWTEDVLHPEKTLTEDERISKRKAILEKLTGLPVKGKQEVVKTRMDEIGKERGWMAGKPSKIG